MKRFVGLVAVYVVVFANTFAEAELVETSGTIKELNVADHTLTLVKKRGTKEKLLELEISQEAKITVGNAVSSLDKLAVGDEVSIKYDSTLEVVVALEKKKTSASPPRLSQLSNLLASKFAASKTTFRPSTGELTLTYDFSKPAQLKDFECADGAARAGNGGLRVSAAEKITHIVEFSRGTVSGRFAYGNNRGEQVMLAVTGRASVQFHKFNEMWMQLYSEGRELARKDAGHSVPLTLLWDISGSKTRLLINAKAELAAPRGEAGEIGRFELHGGNGGLTLSGLTISGLPKEGWVDEFLSR
jgi:hypothetical protein